MKRAGQLAERKWKRYSIQIPRRLAGSEDERECADGENEREG